MLYLENTVDRGSKYNIYSFTTARYLYHVANYICIVYIVYSKYIVYIFTKARYQDCVNHRHQLLAVC